MSIQDEMNETPVDWQCQNCKAVVRGPKEYNGIVGVRSWVPGDCPSCGVSQWAVRPELTQQPVSIKDTIRAMPDGDMSITGPPSLPFYSSPISGKGLKALVDSHDDLLLFCQAFEGIGVITVERIESDTDAFVLEQGPDGEGFRFVLNATKIRHTLAEAEKL